MFGLKREKLKQNPQTSATRLRRDLSAGVGSAMAHFYSILSNCETGVTLDQCKKKVCVLDETSESPVMNFRGILCGGDRKTCWLAG